MIDAIILLESRVAELEAALAMQEAVIARKDETIAMLKAAPSLFHDVLTISPRYVRRFGGMPTIEGATRKVEEEYSEFMEAIKNLVAFAETGHHAGIEEELEFEAAKEAIDLMVTVGGLLDAAHVRYTSIDAAGHSTLKKLTDRKEEDYQWNPATMTVEKKSKIGVNHG